MVTHGVVRHRHLLEVRAELGVVHRLGALHHLAEVEAVVGVGRQAARGVAAQVVARQAAVPAATEVFPAGRRVGMLRSRLAQHVEHRGRHALAHGAVRAGVGGGRDTALVAGQPEREAGGAVGVCACSADSTVSTKRRYAASQA